MSGTSRIGGYGGYAGTGGKQSRSASLVRFCRGRKRGDVVSGTFLRMETEDLGWALLEGEELLAHLPEHWGEEGRYPSPGEHVFFRIDEVAPSVILRLLSIADPLARIAAVLPSYPVAQEAVLYTAARDTLDALLAGHMALEPAIFVGVEPAARKAAFIERVATDTELFCAFAEAFARSQVLCRAAFASGLLFFQHMPWLCGNLTQIEISLWGTGDFPVWASARLFSKEKLLLRGRMENGILHYHLEIAGVKDDKVSTRVVSSRSVVAEYPLFDARGRPRAMAQSVDLVGHILALAAESDTTAAGRFSRKL